MDDYVTDVYAVQDSVFPIEHVYYSNNVDTTFVTSIPKPNGIVTGGYVSWIENLDFNVTPSAYYLNGFLYTTSSTDLTLDAADATYDRIDIIVIDTTETAFVIDGVAAESPQKPNC